MGVRAVSLTCRAGDGRWGQASFRFPSAAIGVADDATSRMAAHSLRPQQRLTEGSEVMTVGSHESA